MDKFDKDLREVLEKVVFDKQEQDFCAAIDDMTVALIGSMVDKASRDDQVWSVGGMAVDLTSEDTIQYVRPAMDDLYAQFVQVVRDWAVKNRVELKPKPTAS